MEFTRLPPMIGKIETQLINKIESKGCLFVVLLDPDTNSPEQFIQAGISAVEQGVDALFIGGSFIGNTHFPQMMKTLSKEVSVPVILFPGGASQITPGPDAILFTTLVSGRNPQYLIDEQIKGAVLVKSYGMEPLPTAYMLIESGATTAVEYISNTKPIPANKPMIAGATALAAQMMGHRWVYLEAGSGALNPVPPLLVSVVRNACDLKVIVGGGIKSPEAAAERVKAGAQAIVIGTAYEKLQDPQLLKEIGEAIHSK